MADIDRVAFACAVAGRLAGWGLSYGQAVEKMPELDKAMLSRAVNGKALSAANFLLVCRLLRLNPYRFLMRDKRKRKRLRDIAKRVADQAVTQGDKRETQARRAMP